MTPFMHLAVPLALLLSTLAVGERLQEMALSQTGGNAADTETLSRTGRQSPLDEGEAVYRKNCARCHDDGVSGAPRLGDRSLWEVRLATGLDNMLRHAIEGYQGNQGVHPPRGGNRNLTDTQVEEAVRYMMQQVPPKPPGE